MKKLALANLPTNIRRMDRWSDECGKNIYVKRDDQTGSELSGNKIRKLEFAVQEAQEKGCNLLITCGGIQSNHCRATVSVATYLGMKSAVLLRISEEPPVEGNYFLDRLLGADVRFCTREEYRDHRGEIMQEMADAYAAQGYKPYIIPEGASFGVGVQGYYYAMKEIVEQHPEILERAKAAFLTNGVEPIVKAIRGGTDGAQLSFRGLPCPNLSTGGYNFHGRKELVPVQAMEKMTEVLVTLVSVK